MPRYALLTYMKAGSQWVRDVIFGAQTLALVPGARLLGPAHLTDRFDSWFASPELTCSGPFYNTALEEWAAWSRPEDRALHVYRDPRDRLISWVFSMTVSHVSLPVIEAVRAPLRALETRDRIAVAIVLTGQAGIWMTRSWLDPEHAPKNFYSVAFERLVEEPSREFAAIFEAFEWDVSVGTLQSILDGQAFEVRSGGRARGDTNEQSHYRRGVAGDWKNYFDRDLGRLFEENYPNALVALGYEKSVTWYESLPDTLLTLASAGESVAAQAAHLASEAERLRGANEGLEARYVTQSRLLAKYHSIAAAMTEEA